MEDHLNIQPTKQVPSTAQATVMHNVLKPHSSQVRPLPTSGATLVPAAQNSIFGRLTNRLMYILHTLALLLGTTNVKEIQSADRINRDITEFVIKTDVG